MDKNRKSKYDSAFTCAEELKKQCDIYLHEAGVRSCDDKNMFEYFRILELSEVYQDLYKQFRKLRKVVKACMEINDDEWWLK